jgi:alpha-tubulin suppressor-like RCC1 family protein
MAWGYNGDGELGNGTAIDSHVPVAVNGLGGVVAIAGGYFHSLALRSDGTVMAWGSNSSGQLGNGNTTNSSAPVAVTALNGAALSGVTAIAAGSEHTLALMSYGTVMAWGRNDQGQLGNGTTTNSSAPAAVIGLGVEEDLRGN